MAVQEVDLALLRRFEQKLDPEFPERCEIPTRVLGYGEISTVLEIGNGPGSDLAYKRMSMFKTEQEAELYEALYKEYLQMLQERIGLAVVPSSIVRFVDADSGRIVVYIIQDRLSSDTIGHKVIHHLSRDDAKKLILAVLRQITKVFDFNRQHKGRLEVGFDAQISNWAVVNFDPEAPALSEEINLLYFDTSAPLMRKNGQEQLNSELFLRCAPSFLVPVLRLLFLDDVMTRYYDIRKVAIDLLANFYKEQRSDLVPELVDVVNRFFATEIEGGGFKPVSVSEVRGYYREDVWIWRLYLTFRKIDRSLHKLVGKHYPYILPGQIKR
jgi:hypothetical protein